MTEVAVSSHPEIQTPNVSTLPTQRSAANQSVGTQQSLPIVSVPTNIQWACWVIVTLFFVGALLIYWRNFRAFKQKYAALSERLDGHLDDRGDGGPSPGHAYVLASRGPKHARDAEMQSALVRWRHLSLAFPHLDDRVEHKRPLILASRAYTGVTQVAEMQQLVAARVTGHVRGHDRAVESPPFIRELGDDFDALRHPQLAIANPAIYTFPFFLTWQRRHQWGVLPYGVHNRLGVICTARHPQLPALRAIEGQYGAALQRTKAENGAFWVNDPVHAHWLPLLLRDLVPDHRDRPALMRDDPKARIFSVGAYLHKELLPLACAVLPDANAGAGYASCAREIEVSSLLDQLADGPDAWPAGSAIIVDLAVLDDSLEKAGWEILRLAHCVYVPIGIGYSVATVPVLLDGSDWRNDMLRDAGEILSPGAAGLASIGIELDERLWTAS